LTSAIDAGCVENGRREAKVPEEPTDGEAVGRVSARSINMAKRRIDRETNEQKAKGQAHSSQDWFSRAACEIAHLSGKPATFLIATAVVILWAVSGPLFGFSDTWQLVINTSTTIITFLMVFLIQNTQNRDTAAMQIKLAELIIQLKGADNKLAAAEDLSEKDLEKLHLEYKKRAEDTLTSLNERRDKAA
jgi:low affinity Fe/Cu permease